MNPKPSRTSHIDFLRAIATILIVVTHVTQYHLNNPVTKFIWNYSHFAVVLFVFCSVSVLLPSYEHMAHTVSSIVTWYKKRVKRLLVPFYWYLVAHVILIVTLPVVFTGNGLVVTPRFLFDSVTLMAGINFNWLVLLFIEIALIFPLIHKVSTKHMWTVLWGIGSFAFILATMFHPELNKYSRILMPIGWSLIVLLSILIVQQKLKPLYVFLISFLSFSLLLILSYLPLHLPLLPPALFSSSFINHKYPPDLYYLSYATMMSMAMYYASKAGVWRNPFLKSVYTFISKNSYQIFFIHYIVLDASLRVQMNVCMHFVTVFSITLAITYFISHFRPLLPSSSP